MKKCTNKIHRIWDFNGNLICEREIYPHSCDGLLESEVPLGSETRKAVENIFRQDPYKKPEAVVSFIFWLKLQIQQATCDKSNQQVTCDKSNQQATL